MVKELATLKMEMCTRECGKMEKGLDQVNKFGETRMFIKVDDQRIRCMGREGLWKKKVLHTLGVSKMAYVLVEMEP